MDKLVQLQEALRAIETGQRLESVDGVLVRQVLLQTRVQPEQAPLEPDAKDLYRELLALRKAKARAKAKQGTDQKGEDGVQGPTQRLSPKKASSPTRTVSLSVDTRLESAPSSPDRANTNNNAKTIAEELAASTTETIELMQSGLVAREKELRRSEKAVARADAELREELTRAEKILPAKFLFERNLAGDRALEAARNVLLRFQHRFYKLYFRRWLGVTLDLRLQAQRQAAAKIVRVYHGHQGRREARRLRKELGVMQAQKRQLLAFRIKYRASQAVKLQMVWRRFLRNRAIKHRRARQAAASFLQLAFRTRQWRSQSLVSALANARRLFAAVSLQRLYRGHRTRRKLAEVQQRQRQEERVRLALLRSMSKQAQAVWMIERRGAGFLIAHQTIFPYAVRLRWHRILHQLRRQRAAKCIARAVCSWFGVEVRREAARIKQVNEWLALVQREHERSRAAAVLIQKHLRRWVQQRKFLTAKARRKKGARRARLAEKARRMGQTPLRKSERHASNRKPVAAVSSSVERKISRFTPGRSPQPARITSLLKPTQPKDGNVKVALKADAEAAMVLQSCYRRYRVRIRVRLSTWRNGARKVEIRVLQRRNAATQIQKRVRGIHGRNLARQRRAERLLLRFILRWKWRRIQKRQRAARKIRRWIKHKRAQHLAKLWHVEKQKQLEASFQLQRWYRLRCLLPSRLRQILKVVRKRDETLVFCDQSLRLCRQHMADEFVVQSLGASLQDGLRPLLPGMPRSPTRSKASPTKQNMVTTTRGKHDSTVVVYPILQLAFLVVSGWKMPFVWQELDGKILLQTKLERTKAVTFFRSLSKRGKPVAHQIRHSPTVEASSTAVSPSRRNRNSPVKGAARVETFSSVNVDVAVARATGGAKGALDFASFVRVIGLLGEISLAQQSQDASPYWGRFDGTDARVLALVWGSLLSHSLMQPLALQFEAFVPGELSRHASCLHRLFARRHNKLRGAAMLVEMRRNLRNQELSRVAIVLQTEARRFLARREMRRRMQETYEKFLDPTWGLPYWTNPRSGYSTWQKPRQLGAEDVRCEPVPFPPPERMLKAPCNGRKDCDRCAEWVCYDCDEFFCLHCFDEYHKAKGIQKVGGSEDSGQSAENSTQRDSGEEDDVASPIKREHELERLMLCGLCKFQLASRRCLDCTPKIESKPKPQFSPQARSGKQSAKKPLKNSVHGTEESNSSEALFCDVCFAFLHRRGGLKAHRTDPLLELCASCIPDDEENTHAATHQPLYTGFSLPGVGDAVQWECSACGDPPLRICGRCALQSHPKESCSRLHPVPLQTLGRRQRTKRLQEEQEARDRADLDKMRARALRARQERCARKIQIFWRIQGPILRARRVVAARRKEVSENWLRRQEDARLAKRVAYRAKNALGIASPLSTDTPVERRLRSLNALARRRLCIRARFFGLLVDEYVTVGIPLPGLGLLHPGSDEVWTSEDLRGWIHNRQTIRVKKLTAQEAQPTERALCAWRQLEHWSKTDAGTAEPVSQGEFQREPTTQSETTGATWLVDVHAKQAITESVIPLAQPYNPPMPKKIRRKAAGADEDENAVEDVPVAMFLVEFSLDPKRTVWINHSLAERFWEWKRLKLLARSEKAEQRQRAKEYEKRQNDLENKRKQEEELKRQEDAANAVDTQVPGGDGDTVAIEPVPNVAAAEQSWPAPTATWPASEATTDPYYSYNYYPSAAPADAAEAWTGYDAYSTNYATCYDYGYESPALETAPAMAGATTELVHSGSYYTNGGYGAADGVNDGSVATDWYGAEYSTYAMSGYSPADGSNGSGWDAYGSATGYAEPQPTIDPSAAWYANEGDSSFAYNATDQWQQSNYAQAQEQGPESYPNATGSSPYDVSASSYSTDVPAAEASADGYYDPYAANGGYDQTYPTSQTTATADEQWEEVFDPASQQTYYVNRVTGDTAWQIPPS